MSKRERGKKAPASGLGGGGKRKIRKHTLLGLPRPGIPGGNDGIPGFNVKKINQSEKRYTTV